MIYKDGVDLRGASRRKVGKVWRLPKVSHHLALVVVVVVVVVVLDLDLDPI